jgi:hypothetical protein
MLRLLARLKRGFTLAFTMTAGVLSFTAPEPLMSAIEQSRSNSTSQRVIGLESIRSFKNASSGTFAKNTGALNTFISATLGSKSKSLSHEGDLVALINKDCIDVEIIGDQGGQKAFSICKRGATFINARFSPDGNNLATIYSYRLGDGSISVKLTIWEPSTGQYPGNTKDSPDFVETMTLAVTNPEKLWFDDLSFSFNGKLLASNFGAVVRMWDIGSKREHQFLPPVNPPGIEPEEIELSRDGKFLAVHFHLRRGSANYDALHIWNLSTGQQTTLYHEVYSDIAFSLDSGLLAFSTKALKGEIDEHTEAVVMEVGSWKVTDSIRPPDSYMGISALGFGVDGILFIGGNKTLGSYCLKGRCFIAHHPHPSPFFAPSRLKGEISTIEVSDTGLLLTNGEDGEARVWRIIKSFRGECSCH